MRTLFPTLAIGDLHAHLAITLPTPVITSFHGRDCVLSWTQVFHATVTDT